MAALTPDGMADAIKDAFPQAWQELKGFPLPMPVPGQLDQQVLFLAIARGVLKYLEDNQNALISSMTLEDTQGNQAGYNVPALALNITVP